MSLLTWTNYGEYFPEVENHETWISGKKDDQLSLGHGGIVLSMKEYSNGKYDHLR